MSNCKLQYGIIGNPLGHSYSEQYFTEKFAVAHVNATYQVLQIDRIEAVLPLLGTLDGFNVTYPYKEAIRSYLTTLDETAREIGAVNVVHRGKGYNTDWLGFRDSLRPLLRGDERALLLGTGGVSKAIAYALKQMGIGYTLVSRHAHGAAIGYAELTEEIMKQHTIIVNCTPLGMHPYEDEMPAIPYEYVTEQHLLYDCIYNPATTRFLSMGEKQGCRVKNGLDMLHIQADRAWEIWGGEFVNV